MDIYLNLYLVTFGFRLYCLQHLHFHSHKYPQDHYAQCLDNLRSQLQVIHWTLTLHWCHINFYFQELNILSYQQFALTLHWRAGLPHDGSTNFEVTASSSIEIRRFEADQMRQKADRRKAAPIDISQEVDIHAILVEASLPVLLFLMFEVCRCTLQKNFYQQHVHYSLVKSIFL